MGFFKTDLSLLAQKKKMFFTFQTVWKCKTKQNKTKKWTNKKYRKKMDFSGKINGENTEIQ